MTLRSHEHDVAFTKASLFAACADVLAGTAQGVR
jgi:hypothetical protein